MTSINAKHLLEIVAKAPVTNASLFNTDNPSINLALLPKHNHALWEIAYGINPMLTADLWVGALAEQLTENRHIDIGSTLVSIYARSTSWIKKIRGHWTDELAQWLDNTYVNFPRSPLLPAKHNHFDCMVNRLWLGDEKEQLTALQQLMTYQAVDIFGESVLSHVLLVQSANKYAQDNKDSLLAKNGAAYANLLLGGRGFSPVDNSSDIETAWHGIGNFHDTKEIGDEDLKITASRLKLIKEEPVQTRVFGFLALLNFVTTTDGIHPVKTSELARWGVLTGVTNAVTLFDAARAFVPELASELTNTEMLGMHITDACKLLLDYEKYEFIATPEAIALPTDITGQAF